MKAITNKTIIRAPRNSESPYFAVSRDAAQDRNLSFEARGLLWYLLSKPDDWEVQPKDLQQHCGRGKVYKLLRELSNSGYLEYQNVKQNGKFSGGVYLVHEIPCVENRHTVLTETPCDEKRDTENRHHTEYRIEQNTETAQKELCDPPAAVAAAPKKKPKTPKPEPTPRPRDPVYDMVAEVWYDTKPDSPTFQTLGGRIGYHVSWLKGNSILVSRKDETGKAIGVRVDGCRWPLNREQFIQAKRDWYLEHEGIHHPTDILKFIAWIDSWMEKQVAKPKYELTPPEERQREINRLLFGEAVP